jgi:membrane-bound serine protease (ClpP class)
LRATVAAAVVGLLAVLGTLGAADASAGQTADATPRVLVATFENDVNPVTADYLEGVIERGERDGFEAVVIEMDTPGGLSSAMRDIVKDILAARVPVIVYVSPGGSSADSAGAVIGQAADVLAMAPQTNIGSSTPISTSGEDISKDLRRKVINDAAAYIGELAREHGRNVAAAEAMVRQASNFGAREALAKDIVDVVAPTLPALLRQVDGTTTAPKGLVLRTADAEVTHVEMSFWKRALDLLIDPNIIALMLSLGLIGIVVELWNPGLIFPGTVGAISLIVGLYGLQVLPVSVAGLLMMLLAAGFFGAEAFLPSHGALTLAGAVTFVIGALMLFDPAGPAYQVSLWTALAVAATLALLFGVALSRVVKARRAPVEVDVHRMAGLEGTVRRAGYVQIAGELWRASPADDDTEALRPGTRVRVDAVREDGLELVVSPVAAAAPTSSPPSPPRERHAS